MGSLSADVTRAAGAWNRSLRRARIGLSLGPALAAAGAAVLVARLFGLPQSAAFAAPALALAAATFVGLRQARSRLVREEAIAALLDLRAGGSGAVLHAWERAGGDSLALPATAPRADRRRVLLRLLPGLIIVALALAVPVRPLGADESSALDPVSRQRAAELEQLAQRLAGSLPLDEAFHAEIEERLREAAAGDEDGPRGEALREALDQLEDRLGQRAEEAASALDQVARELSAAGGALQQAMDEAVARQAASEDPEPGRSSAQQEAERAFAEAIRRLQEEGLLAELPGRLESLPLAERLQGLQGECEAALGRLAEQGLLDPRQLARWSTQPGRATDGEAGIGMDVEGEAGVEALHVGVEREAGQGGITRGPGSSALSWGEESPDLAAEMQAQALPAPSNFEEAMQLLHIAGVAPAADGAAEAVGAAGAAGPTGQAAWQRRTAPHHREAVRRFFDRKE